MGDERAVEGRMHFRRMDEGTDEGTDEGSTFDPIVRRVLPDHWDRPSASER